MSVLVLNNVGVLDAHTTCLSSIFLDIQANIKAEVAGAPILSIKDVGPISCMNECMRRSRCQSINFNIDDHICDINEDYSTSNTSISGMETIESFNKVDFYMVSK